MLTFEPQPAQAVVYYCLTMNKIWQGPVRLRVGMLHLQWINFSCVAWQMTYLAAIFVVDSSIGEGRITLFGTNQSLYRFSRWIVLELYQHVTNICLFFFSPGSPFGTSTRFVGKPERGSAILTYLDLFSGSIQTWGSRGTIGRGGGLNPQPLTNRALSGTRVGFVVSCDSRRFSFRVTVIQDNCVSEMILDCTTKHKSSHLLNYNNGTTWNFLYILTPVSLFFLMCFLPSKPVPLNLGNHSILIGARLFTPLITLLSSKLFSLFEALPCIIENFF